MKQLLTRIFPPEFYTDRSYFRTILFGLLYLVPLIAQLFTFEKFRDVLAALALPGGEVTAAVLSWLLPLLGVMSLPVIISMRLRDTLYRVSCAALVALPLLWLGIGAWSNIAASGAGNSGLFGATLALPVGLWQVVLALLWAVAAVRTVQTTPRR